MPDLFAIADIVWQGTFYVLDGRRSKTLYHDKRCASKGTQYVKGIRIKKDKAEDIRILKKHAEK